MARMISYVSAIGLAMVVNVLLGVVKADHYDEFSKEVLIKSLKRYGTLLASVFGMMGISLLMPSFTFNFNGSDVTIATAMELIANAVLLLHVGKAIKNLLEVLQIKDTDIQKTEQNGGEQG